MNSIIKRSKEKKFMFEYYNLVDFMELGAVHFEVHVQKGCLTPKVLWVFSIQIASKQPLSKARWIV
jgi:hypothetical protein